VLDLKAFDIVQELPHMVFMDVDGFIIHSWGTCTRSRALGTFDGMLAIVVRSWIELLLKRLDSSVISTDRSLTMVAMRWHF
jgi:hypothetical protein